MFDPETGEVLDVRKTELGYLMAVVTDGVTDDPFYHPELLMLEAKYSVLTMGLFKVRMMDGDDLAGLKAVLAGSPFDWLHLSAGISYATKDSNAQSVYQHMDQEMLYTNFQGKIDLPEFSMWITNGTQVTLKNEINAHGAFAVFKNYDTINELSFDNMDSYSCRT